MSVDEYLEEIAGEDLPRRYEHSRLGMEGLLHEGADQKFRTDSADEQDWQEDDDPLLTSSERASMLLAGAKGNMGLNRVSLTLSVRPLLRRCGSFRTLSG